MEELDNGFRRLDLNAPEQIPFQPSGRLSEKLSDTPRYLFRVFSKKTARENNNE
ncbi:hypothetical protein F5Y12DRAFT_770956 [Xylaria sp. FL1777]|nr:hypothetical protein F5Y12DRAFT_770956 [Xylaria sp. FL1777]